jgi:hypothetical protein
MDFKSQISNLKSPVQDVFVDEIEKRTPIGSNVGHNIIRAVMARNVADEFEHMAGRLEFFAYLNNGSRFHVRKTRQPGNLCSILGG